MLTGVFNNIINAGLRTVRGLAKFAAGFLTKTFTAACSVARAVFGQGREEALHLRFNRFCNDNISFKGGEQQEDGEKKARIAYLKSWLKTVMRLVYTGAAQVQDALAVVQELESLGVSAMGLLDLKPHAEPHHPVVTMRRFAPAAA
jgi:hypothetical protein